MSFVFITEFLSRSQVVEKLRTNICLRGAR